MNTETTVEKKPKKKKIITIFILMCILGVAGFIANTYRLDKQKDEKSAYMALRFLEYSDYSMASEYIDKIDSKTTQKVDFARSSAEVIKQKQSGNETLYAINLDIVSTDFKMNEERTSIVEELQNINNDTTSYVSITDDIISSMKIPEKRSEVYSMQFDMESQAINTGYVDETQSEQYAKLAGKDAQENLALTVALSTGDYYGAVQEAITRVQRKPSAENRLILADTIASAAYAGYSIEESQFYSALGKEFDYEKYEKETEKLQKEIEDLQNKIDEKQSQLDSETDGDRTTKLNEDLNDLNDQMNKLQKNRNNTMIYKAMNSILNIPTVEADIIEAKLYYAMDENQKAMDTLVKASDSIEKKLSSNDTAKQGLDLIQRLRSGEVDSAVAKDENANRLLTNMFQSTIDIPIKTNEDYYTVNLASDLAGAILSEYKYQDNDIYISSVDDSEYPNIEISVTALEELLKALLNKKNIVLKDTHKTIDSYEVEKEESGQASICFVVDVSGSMDGQPLNDAKSALVSFADTLDNGTEVALAQFDDMGTIVTPITININEFVNASKNLNGGGGTDIGAGILSGVEALRNASGDKNLILMTDGQSDIDYSVVDQAAEEGVTIFTVGFGQVNEEMLEEIATRTGGTFTLADNSGDLSAVYNAIGALIGNRITIRYTVTENVEEVPRYVFIRATDFNTSSKRNYRTNLDEEDSTVLDSFYIRNVSIYELGDMQWYTEDNVDLYLETTNDDNVSSIELNGRTYSPEEDEWQLRFLIAPFTQEGLYDLIVNFKDGSSFTAEKAVVVYDGSRENAVLYYPEIKIGCVLIEPNRAIIMPDGTTVLEQPDVYDYKTENEEATLSAYTYTTWFLSGYTYSNQIEEGQNYYNWGEQAQFHMTGELMLSGSDAQNQGEGGYETISACGKLVGTITPDQCSIQKE